MSAPESPDGINQEIKGNWGRRDENCNCSVESCNVLLEEGYGACDKNGIDSGHLIIECLFHAFWGVEYEDSWRGGYL